MGFMNRSRIDYRGSFRLTQEGREKVQEFSGDPASRVLMALECHNTSMSIDELSRELRIPVGQLEPILARLTKSGYTTQMFRQGE